MVGIGNMKSRKIPIIDFKPNGSDMVSEIDYRVYQELLESEEKFRKTAEAAQDAIIILNSKGNISYWNKAAERIFGYSKEEALGREGHIFLAPERYHEAYRTGFSKFRETGCGNCVDTTLELEAIRKDGTEFPVELSVSAVKLRGEWNAIGILRDITERKKIEKALKESEERLQDILDYTTAVIYVKDVDGRYILVNRQFEKLFNVSKDQIVGKTDYDLFPEEMANAFRMNDLIVLDRNCPIEFEEVVPHDDGVHTYISIKFPLHADNVPYAVCGISTDITERKKTEEELRKYRNQLEELVEERTHELKQINEKLQKEIGERRKVEKALVQLNEVLKLMNKNLRHDILNDLAIVSTSIEMYDEIEDKKLLQNALKSVRKSVELIKKMRELESLITSGGSLKPVNAKETIEDIISNYSLEYTIKGKCTVVADETLSSVIDNIIRNAVLHGKTDRIDIKIEKLDDYCEIRIADNGKGIPDEIKDDIFEEGFSYGDSGGSGLGLYIVKKTIERYDGSVRVENNKPSGSVFVIHLKPHEESVCETVCVKDT